MESNRQKIKKHIQRYFDALRVGQEFNGIDLADYALKKSGCENKYRATVIQYMNQMKRAGLINYDCTHREKSKFVKR
jgi:hypothetical protein